MKWWLTTHYPHRDPKHPWHIYIKKKYEEKGQEITEGDRVAFYELKGDAGKGRHGVIGFARVSSRLIPNPHTDGLVERWELQRECSEHELGKPVHHRAVCNAINRKSNGPMRIESGLRELTEEQFNDLYSRFRARQGFP